jgi:hypothetical protein
MAHLIPSDLTRLALAGAHAPELRTLALLKDALPDDYNVFHGVRWSRQYKGATVYGEIDFIVMNRAGDVLLFEQKNGPLEEDEDGLHKHYGEVRKSVGDQILRAVANVKEKFGYQFGSSALPSSPRPSRRSVPSEDSQRLKRKVASASRLRTEAEAHALSHPPL